MFETILVIFLVAALMWIGVDYFRLDSTKKELFDLKEKTNKIIKEKIEEERSKIQKEFEEKSEKEQEEFIKKMEEIHDAFKENIKEVIEKADEMVGDELKKLVDKNTLFFTCVCDPQTPIPCFIDFSLDEINYTCPKCGGLYKVVIDVNTILKGKTVNPEKIIDLVEEKIKNEK